MGRREPDWVILPKGALKEVARRRSRSFESQSEETCCPLLEDILKGIVVRHTSLGNSYGPKKSDLGCPCSSGAEALQQKCEFSQVYGWG